MSGLKYRMGETGTDFARTQKPAYAPRVAIIGFGAAGGFAGYSAALSGAEVTIFEKNEKPCKKLFITGKGRANITNDCDVNEFLTHVVTNSKFLRTALYNFTPSDTKEFFNTRGLLLKTERGDRVFPASDKSSDVIKTISSVLKSLNVNVKYNTAVRSLFCKNGKMIVNGEEFDSVIIASGGLSYSSTGSTGDGYKFAKNFGHTLIEPLPALSAIIANGFDFSRLAGLSLKNVTLKVYNQSQLVAEEFGEMLFTHNGISGPIALTISSKINRILKKTTLNAEIDLKPALTADTLDKRLLREFEIEKNKTIKNIFPKLLPIALVDFVLKQSKIPNDKQANAITKSERISLINSLKAFKFTLTGLESIDRAIVTAGGIDVREINPATMESRLQKNLFFAGEVLDVDAETGGFNLQIAFSTGMLAGKSCVKV